MSTVQILTIILIIILTTGIVTLKRIDRTKARKMVLFVNQSQQTRILGVFDHYLSVKITTDGQHARELSGIAVSTATQKSYIFAAYGDIKEMLIDSNLQNLIMVSGEEITAARFTALAFPKSIYNIAQTPVYPSNYILIRPPWNRAENKDAYFAKLANHRALEELIDGQQVFEDKNITHIHDTPITISVLDETIIPDVADPNRYCQECGAKLPTNMQICEICGCDYK